MRSFIHPFSGSFVCILKDLFRSSKVRFALFLLFFLLSASDGFCLATRYQVTAPNAPVGATAFCSGATVGSYTNQPGSSSCSITGSAATNTITWQWVYDGTNISGATGTFVVGSGTPAAVTLTAAQAAILSSLSVGAHTLQCKYTPNTTDCGGTAGVAIFSPALTFYVLGPPGSITGTASTCVGATTTLSNSVAGGTWSSVSGTGSASVSGAGVVTGSTTGTVTISYTTGCGTPVSRVVTVNPAISSITGSSSTCVSNTVSLSNSTPSGTWSSSNTAVSTVSSSGVVTGTGVGTTNILYTVSGCTVSMVMAVGNTAPPVAVSASPTNFCSGGTSNLSATSTVSNYTVNTTSFAPVSFTPTGTFNSSSSVASGTLDDGYFTVSMPFAFNFYGSAVPSGSTCYIGTNGLIAFGTGITTTYIGTLPNSSYPSALISVFGRDLYLNSGGTITYGTTGTSPNRKFIVSYNSVPDYSTLVLETGQLVIYESNSQIDLHITTAQASSHTLGIQNSGASLFAEVPGHNNTSTAISNSAWKFEWPKATSYIWSPSTFLSATTGASVSANAVTGTTTYTVTGNYGGCVTNAVVTVTVNTSPAAITGTAAMCVGATSTLANTVGAGTWSSSNTGVATIGAASGAVSGLSAGTATITYTVTSSGCYATRVVTILTTPANIGGSANVCVDATTSLSNSVSGGTWISTNTSAATINTSGVVTGVSSGVSMITYTLTSTGCYKTQEVTVNPLPTINVTPAASANVCAGNSTSFTATSPALQFSLLNQNFNSALGSWVVSTPTDPGDGISPWKLTSSSAIAISGDGTQMLEAAPSASSSSGYMVTHLTSPSFSTMGFGSAVLAFNEHLYSNALADVSVKVQYSINGGGSWVTFIDQVPVTTTDSMVGTGSWDAASPEVSVSLPSAALNLPNVKLRWLYETNWGGWWEIDNISLNAALPGATFTWANVGVATGLSCTSCPSPTITPGAVGINIYSVTANSTCSASTTVTVNVNPLPGIIGGVTATLCVGSSISLSNPDGGGTWSSPNSSVVSVDPASGVVTGLGAGIATISYQLSTGCVRTATVNVDPAPATIGGMRQVCEGAITSLSHEVTGGVWSSASSLVSVDAASGATTGGAVGNAIVTYVLPSGCRTTAVVTVNQLPDAFTGIAVVCENATTSLESTPAGGTWTSGDDLIAAIAAGTNEVAGVHAGTTPVTYSLSTGCSRSAVVTVNSVPEDIEGTIAVCEGQTTSLNCTTPGGIWSAASSTYAAVDINGVVEGLLAGNSAISYTLSTGCYKSVVVTVNELPTAISGTAVVCEGATTALTCSPAGGAWTSGDNSIASITVANEVQGVLEGMVPVTYSLATGCRRSTVVTVNAAPQDISGIFSVCESATTILSNGIAGGAWTSSLPSIADFTSTFGQLAGSSAGNATVSYTLSNGCYKTAAVTVNITPTVISGTASVCEGLTTVLGSSPVGGSWSSDASVIASVDGVSGEVFGHEYGLATISYAMSTGCSRAVSFAVNALPQPINGAPAVCMGSTISLESATAGGVWSSNNTGIADVGASGDVEGIAQGNTDITYTMSATGCFVSKNVSVNPLPDVITGTLQVCEGLTTTLENSTMGGNWSTSSTTIASVNGGGVVNGISAGAEIVTYGLPTGCTRTAAVIVNPLPGDFTGSLQVCEGLSTLLGNTSPGGSWSGGSPSVATIAASGLVTAVGVGTTTVTYTLNTTGCQKSAEVAVNSLPADITGLFAVCEGAVTTLANATPGGSWSSLSSNGSVNALGVVSGSNPGTATIVYMMPTGCLKSVDVLVNQRPGVITGTLEVCEGSTTSLENATVGGSWSSSTVTGASITGDGIVTGIVAGIAPVTYSLTNGCIRTADVAIHAMPGDITGVGQVCEGATTSLVNTIGGGSWLSDNTSVAQVNAWGVVDGVSQGSAIIKYQLSTGCSKSATVVVNPIPDVITGTMEVCEGAATALSCTPATGTWSSVDVATAAVNLNTGIVTGANAGTVSIRYILPTGCSRATDVTVKELPEAIDGASHVCEGLATTLTNGTPGGTWLSSDVVNAPIDGMGVVSGIAQSIASIIYTGPNGCSTNLNMEVYAAPATIVGPVEICEGNTAGLTNITSAGVWSSSDGSIADVDVLSGVVSGMSPGVAIITYALTNGCMQTSSMAVNALPSPITGTLDVCEGSTTALASGTTGGIWSVATGSSASVDATGVVRGLTAGVADITYALATGCQQVATVVVNAMPAINSVSGGGPYCAGTSGVAVGLALSENGVDYQLYRGGVSIGSVVAGSGSPLNFGLQTGAGVYSVQAINNTTGCVSDMAGSTTVSITPLNIPSVAVTSGGGSTICAGTLTAYTAVPVNGGALPAYAWEVNGIPVAGVTSSNYNYIPVNGDIVKVTLLSNEVCAIPATASDVITMSVNANKTPVATIAYPPGVTSVCKGSNITLTASSVFGGSTPSYAWIKNGMPTGVSGTTFSYMPDNGDVVKCELTSNYTCVTASVVTSNVLTMITDPVYVPVVSLVVSPGAVIASGTPVTFTSVVSAASAGPYPSYQWFKNGVIISGATNSTHSTSTLVNSDSISCRVSGTAPCGFESFNSVLMLVKTTGIDDFAGGWDKIVLLPNPNKGDFVIKGELAASVGDELSIQVTNMLGQTVYVGKAATKAGLIHERIRLSNHLANGMYLLSLRTGSELKVIHFVVEQ